MATSKWLDAVARELADARIPSNVQGRLLDELRDHVEDLFAEERNRSMSSPAIQNKVLEQRMGAPCEIARQAEQQWIRTNFASRHPIWTFVLAPVPGWLLCVALYVIMLVALCNVLGALRDVPVALALAGVLFGGAAYVPAALLSLLIGWVAIRSNIGRRWWLSAALVVAVLSSLLAIRFQMPTAPGTGQLNVGLGFPPPVAHWPQLLVPLLITGILMSWAAAIKGPGKAAAAQSTS